MHAPKFLPWLAQRSGITNDRAEALWREAMRAAARRTHCVGTPAFWSVAVEHVHELVAAEARSCNLLHHVLRAQRVWATLPFETWGGLALAGCAAWRSFLAPAQEHTDREARRA